MREYISKWNEICPMDGTKEFLEICTLVHALSVLMQAMHNLIRAWCHQKASSSRRKSLHSTYTQKRGLQQTS